VLQDGQKSFGQIRGGKGTERDEKPKFSACVACCTACGIFLLSLNFSFLLQGIGVKIWSLPYVLHGWVLFLGQGGIIIDGRIP
jgi:hypothetical protein